LFNKQAEGLVAEVGRGSSSGGKMPILLDLVDDARHVLGLDLAHDRLRGAVVNLRGAIRHRLEATVRPRDGRATLEGVFALVDRLVAAAGGHPVGIGVGSPGLVDARRGTPSTAIPGGELRRGLCRGGETGRRSGPEMRGLPKGRAGSRFPPPTPAFACFPVDAKRSMRAVSEDAR